MSSPDWELIQFGGGNLGPRYTVYHHLPLAKKAWASVKQEVGGFWGWAIYDRPRHKVAYGLSMNWQTARKKAEAAAKELDLR